MNIYEQAGYFLLGMGTGIWIAVAITSIVGDSL